MPRVTGVKRSIDPVLASLTALAAPSWATSPGAILSASAGTPAGTNAMLEEPSDHSAPGPVTVPFSVTPPIPSIDSEPREAIEAPVSIATFAAPVDDAPPLRTGISQLRSDTASRPALPPPEPESVTDRSLGNAASGPAAAAEFDRRLAPFCTSMD